MSSKERSSEKSLPSQPTFVFPGQDADKRPRWSQVDTTVLKAFVDAWTDVDGAALFGHTKDVTALNLTLYMGPDKASYTYGQVAAAENALREYTEWAIDWGSRGLKLSR